MNHDLLQDPCEHFFSEENRKRLVDDGLLIIENALPGSLIKNLGQDCLSLWSHKQFKRAGVGQAKDHQVNAAIRSDSIYWWDPLAVSGVQQRFWRFIQGLCLQLNQHFFMGLQEAEFHYAVYPKGAFYGRHMDQFRGNNLRKISIVLFLNKTWLKADGGHLRLYEEAPLLGYQDIRPTGGGLALFCSDRVLHEVLPTFKQRLSLTGWLKTRV